MLHKPREDDERRPALRGAAFVFRASQHRTAFPGAEVSRSVPGEDSRSVGPADDHAPAGAVTPSSRVALRSRYTARSKRLVA
jgi:hypothetical protein